MIDWARWLCWAKSLVASSGALKHAVAAAEAELGDSGRVLVRPSGTEPAVRVMVEAVDPAVRVMVEAVDPAVRVMVEAVDPAERLAGRLAGAVRDIG